MAENRKKIAMVLSGCGYQEGTEVTEAVSALIALSELDCAVQCFAPLEVLAEAQKIARDSARSLAQLDPKQFDALVLPGGYGAAKVLSSFASEAEKASMNSDLKRIVCAFHSEQKPIGAICIAPALVALALGDRRIELTIGNDPSTAAILEKLGAIHVSCSVENYVSDRDNKVLSTPAYMLEATPSQVYNGIRKMLRELVEMA